MDELGRLGGTRGRGRGPASIAAVALRKQRRRLPRARLEDEDAGDPHGEAAAARRLGEGWIWCSGSERKSSSSCWWVEENEEKGIPRWIETGWRRRDWTDGTSLLKIRVGLLYIASGFLGTSYLVPSITIGQLRNK